MTRLADQAWPDVATSGCTVLVPVGSLEQHGPHLPLDTDTVIAQAVCDRLVEMLGDSRVVVGPAVAYGSSGEHQHFPGTSSIGTEVLRLLVVELTRSMRTWAGRVVYVNGHGGNVVALEAAVGQLQAEGHDVAWLPCATEDVDLHAGLTETSLLLHLCPERVSLDRAECGNTSSLAELMPAMLAGGVRAVSSNGVLGDPTGATSEEGQRVLEDVCRRLVGRVLESGSAFGGNT
jgi:mycofactocin system creatininase family protein